MRTDQTLVRFEYKNQKTKAIVLNRADKTVLAERSTKVRHGDIFDKKEGRKYAFQKVMSYIAEQDILPKQERTALWLNFRTVVKQPSR